MKQEDKELLLKDLCARLDTNLVCSIYRTDDEGVGYRDEILHGYCKGDIWYEFYFREDCSISIDNVSKIKPYLFPLSSMTEESAKELYEMYGFSDEETWIANYIKANNVYGLKLFSEIGFLVENDLDILLNWLHKYQFDYRGLIEKGLAIDATGLNIYKKE